MPVTSNTKPTVGRIGHVYAARAWTGPRAGVVVMAWPDSGCANVNVQLDSYNDKQLVEFLQRAAGGNTLPSIPVYDALTDDERKGITIDYWMEWPPVKASGQSNVVDRLTALEWHLQGASEWSQKIDARLAEAESKLGTLLTQFNEFLTTKVIDVGQPFSVPAPATKISLAKVTRSNHEKWLAGGDRSYSKYNRPYDQLTAPERREVSLTVVNTLEAVAEATGQSLVVLDDFDDEAKAASKSDETKPTPGSES